MKSKKVAGPLKDLTRQTVCLADQLAADIYTAAATQRSKELLISLETGNYSRIVSASVDPQDYIRGNTPNVDMFKRDYLSAELMSKFPEWDLGIDRAAVARKTFFEVEERLAQLRYTQNHEVVLRNKRTTMHAILMTARNKIFKILGDADLNEIHSLFAFGPGASTSLPKRRADASYKFGAQRPHLSYNAIPLADALVRAHPTWQFNAEVVAGSKLITVPKNAKTDRTICVEPDLNMYFQKGLGRAIRRRLQRWGLLKKDAQQYNAKLAQEGSAYGRLATVDLSSASDSIHMGLVRDLFPTTWVDLFELTRSPMVVLPSEDVHILRKVSSMGNGYTFELETCLFYALCTAVIDLLATRDMDHRCTVFGDDIIIDGELVPALEEVLSYLGFVMNPKKTFSSGMFRESCGKHYFAGCDVTPFYIRGPIDNVLRKYWAANTIKRYSRLAWGLDSTYYTAYRRVVDDIPTYLQGFKIPEGYGDGGLVSDWDDVRPSRCDRGHDAWKFSHVVPRVKGIKLRGQGTLLKALHSLEFPRDNPEVADAARAIDQRIGVVLAGHDHLAISEYQQGLPLEMSEINELLVFLARQDGLGESYLAERPKITGYKVSENGKALRWENFGPWL
jgi:hypothetical protein